MSDTAIKVEGLSKLYKIGSRQNGYKTLRESIANAASSPFRRLSSIFSRSSSVGISPQSIAGQPSAVGSPDPSVCGQRSLVGLGQSSVGGRRSAVDSETLWALKNISFEVQRGEVVGIIGRNGAGKSTLLKILSRITEPTEGHAEIRGRVGSLLEVGTGFHAELSGRENIYLSGAILGMRKAEIERKFDEIVAFAEMEKFLDTPVKHYSSGMYVRLAFAVAAHLEPEILLVDEVLAVGDIGFQKKCLGKMGDVAREGRTVLFVSHNMAAINLLCEWAILLENGLTVAQGNTRDCIDAYIVESNHRSGTFLDHMQVKESVLQITDAKVNGFSTDTLRITSNHTKLELELEFIATSTCRVSLHAFLKDRHEQTLGVYSPGHVLDDVYSVKPGNYKLSGSIILPKLIKGKYFLDIGISEPGIRIYTDFPLGLELQVDGYPTKTGLVFDQSNANGFQILEGSVTLSTTSILR